MIYKFTRSTPDRVILTASFGNHAQLEKVISRAGNYYAGYSVYVETKSGAVYVGYINGNTFITV